MDKQYEILTKISEALLMDYSSVYYVNAQTNQYYWYSVNPEYHSLKLEQGGDDFFKNIKRDCKAVIYEEDQHIFLEDIQKEKLLSFMKKGSKQSIEYRLVIKGVPTWHALKVIRGPDEDTDYFILGVININEEYKRRQIEKEVARQKKVYNQITASLAGQYDTLYYIDVNTNKYVEISSTNEYKKLNVPVTGSDFFAESRRSIRKYVHPEDQEKILRYHYKDTMLKNLEGRTSFSVEYRLVVEGQVKNIRHTEIISGGGSHIIVCIQNIDNEINTLNELNETRKKSATYTQIAESLAAHYDLIYYINAKTEHYMEFATHKIYGELEVQEEADNFFDIAESNAERLIHPEDRARLQLFLNKDNLISRLDVNKQLVEDYRMMVDGEVRYTRMTVSWSSDKTHFIICIENREEDVKREKEQLRALNTANEMARKDSLTGTRNKTAFQEFERDLQKSIEEDPDLQFGLVICDLNDLKFINDTQGHKAGDDYIQDSCRLICRLFSHSPVFRIGGDEFVIVLKDQDYAERVSLMDALGRQVEENIRVDMGPVVASGLAEFQPGVDRKVEDIFKRADERMYENKSHLKDVKMVRESYSLKEQASFKMITEERRRLLDALYRSYEIVAEGTYVFVCDMKFDFSRWSKSAVDKYELPAEYMYGAGDIWEEHIHLDDREAYRIGIEEVFKGDTSGHDMQYRARRPDGEYDVCTCRGVVLRDSLGEPDYFVGAIRDHSTQGHIDKLTGFRNQYGFFDDLNSYIKRNATIHIVVVGISKFSEVNSVYGYEFGNRVLQLFGRKLYDQVGNSGLCYKLDGTKFAIISNILSPDEIRANYIAFRNYFREEFEVDGSRVLLETNCAALKIDRFDFDSQTVYACLNYAYVESKSRNQGDIVFFNNDLNADNRQRLEKLHAIRASIMHGYRGFYLLYQPVVDAHSEKLISAEALLRWKNDQYGMVPPDQFIPLLESDPLFPDLGEWIIREAIISAKKVIKENPDFVININLSYTQIEKHDFVDMVYRILEDLNYPPDHLCFEVTERCRLLDIDLLKNVTASLKSRGILIALDDFGTGFSSIGIVKELPFDIIKIDRTFVQQVEQNQVDRELIKHFSGLASLFGAKVCVEGVETSGMRDILQQFNVGSFQGYYYAKPLELADFFSWLSDRGGE